MQGEVGVWYMCACVCVHVCVCKERWEYVCESAE